MRKKQKEGLNINALYRIYVEWKARPQIRITNNTTPQEVEAIKNLKIPKNNAEFSKKYGITDEDIRGFISRPEYHEELRQATVHYGKSQLTGLLHLALEKAKSSNKISDIETTINLIENLKKRIIDNPDQEALFDRLTDEDYERIISREVNTRIADGKI